MADTEVTSGVPHKSKGFSFWGKVGLIAGAGLCLVAFGGVMYLNSTGILPAANRLKNARAAYESSGAPKSGAELEALFQVPDDVNAALIFDYFSGIEGMEENLELPLTGKTGEKYTISWSKFIADVDRAQSMPHFRPKRDFNKPYSILFPEWKFFRGSIRELFSQAVQAVESGKFDQAEKCVKRIAIIDGWIVDQPFLIIKLLRLQGTQIDMNLVGALTKVPAGQPAVVRILETLKTTAERNLGLESVAKVEAFSLSRLQELGEELESSYRTPGAISTRTATSPIAELESKAFAYALKSSLGREAIAARGYEVAGDFYREWARSKDLDKAFDACDDSFGPSDQTPLSSYLEDILPVSGGGSLGSLNRSSIGVHMYMVALWIYERKGDPKLNLAKISSQDLPKELQIDPLDNPIRLTRSGNELRIYSFGVDGKDDGGFSKDTGFSIQLKP